MIKEKLVAVINPSATKSIVIVHKGCFSIGTAATDY